MPWITRDYYLPLGRKADTETFRGDWVVKWNTNALEKQFQLAGPHVKHTLTQTTTQLTCSTHLRSYVYKKQAPNELCSQQIIHTSDVQSFLKWQIVGGREEREREWEKEREIPADILTGSQCTAAVFSTCQVQNTHTHTHEPAHTCIHMKIAKSFTRATCKASKKLIWLQ